MMTFPDHFPSQCPPDEAKVPDSSVELYRLVVNDPPTEEDVRSNFELGKVNSDSCSGRGLSFYTKPDGLERNARDHPYFKNMKVAKLYPDPAWGVAYRGKSRGRTGAHVNLWIYLETDRQEIVSALEIT